MEDAMILNKSAVDRGMFRGDIFQVIMACEAVSCSFIYKNFTSHA